jgi:hypothetical protein
VAPVAAAPARPNSQPIYRPRGPDPLRTLFRRRFPDFQDAYEQRYASKYGRFRLPIITRAASAFSPLGWALRRLCPSCAQKRTLLLGEYLSEDPLLTLPHRQFVWTIPKVLRVFFRHDRELFADLGRLLFDILQRFFSQAAGRPLRTAGILVFQTAGAFCRFHSLWHGLFLEGGFEHENRFVHVPTVDLQKMSCCFRQRGNRLLPGA